MKLLIVLIQLNRIDPLGVHEDVAGFNLEHDGISAKEAVAWTDIQEVAPPEALELVALSAAPYPKVGLLVPH